MDVVRASRIVAEDQPSRGLLPTPRARKVEVRRRPDRTYARNAVAVKGNFRRHIEGRPGRSEQKRPDNRRRLWMNIERLFNQNLQHALHFVSREGSAISHDGLKVREALLRLTPLQREY